LPEPFISYTWNNEHDSLKIGLDTLYLQNNKRLYHYQFSEIVTVNLLTKKKLGPLVIGAILSSLAMVNILLEGAALYKIGLLSIGLLILYFGLTEYWVIQVVHPTETTQLWINKNKTPSFPEVILSVVHFRITQGVFPVLYCSVPKSQMVNYIEERNELNPENANVYYSLLPPKKELDHVKIKVDITKLSMPIKFIQKSNFLAEGLHKINKSALLDIEV